MAAGREIGRLLDPPKLLILCGELGAGKTTLVKGIAQAFRAAEPDEVTSPTFTLIHEYEGFRGQPGGKGGERVRLYHLDLYRLGSMRQVAGLGIEDLSSSDAVVLVEWGEKFPELAALSDGEILIERVNDNRRRITLELKKAGKSA